MRKLLLVFFAIFIISCRDSSPVEGELIDTEPDTIIEQEYDTLILNENNKSNFIIDSLQCIIDSINEELFVAKYKLKRIENYNEIAAKGNNIKYLRGWIRRTLNE